MQVQAGPQRSTLSSFTWFFLAVKGRISRQEFGFGFFGLVLVDMLVIRIGVTLDPGPRYDDGPPTTCRSCVCCLSCHCGRSPRSW